MRRNTSSKGFSLLELVVVVVIIGIIAAVAIPRLSRGSAGAADAALAGNLAVLRNAIDLYSVEHDGAFPARRDIEDALLEYTDHAGDVKNKKTETHIYGPYIRKIPPLPVGAAKGNTRIWHKKGKDVGWIYDEDTGDIHANCTNKEQDATGKRYNEY